MLSQRLITIFLHLYSTYWDTEKNNTLVICLHCSKIGKKFEADISSAAAELYFFSQNNSLAWRTEALPNNFGRLAKVTIPYFEKLFLFIMHRNCAITMHFPPKILSFFKAHVNIWCKNLSKNLISYFDSGILKNAPALHPLVEIELFHLQVKIATVSCKNCKTKKY